MGVLIEGVWRDEELPQEVGRVGEFPSRRQPFRDRITADGSSGFKAEAGRYHLYVAHGCPWAHRTLIYRALKKLEGADLGRLCNSRASRRMAGRSRTIPHFRTARPTR